MTRRARTAGALGASIALVALVAEPACGFDDAVLRDAPSDAGADAEAPDVALSSSDAALSDVYGVYAGQYFTCALAGGLGYCWGSNVLGALGIGQPQSRLAPTAIALAAPSPAASFTTLAPGENHTCGLEAQTGQILCWGSDASGQVGLGAGGQYNAPQAVPGLGPAAQISAGYGHTCAVLRDGSLWCWGANEEGQLGLGPNDGTGDRPTPTRVGTASDWTFVSGGQGHTCGLRAPGTLWCWGRNSGSELGLGLGQPIQFRTPMQVGLFDDWTFIDLGQGNACGLRRDGSLWCWGEGGSGELVPVDGGIVSTPTRVGSATDWVTVSTDIFATCAISSAGQLSCWGRNAEGQLGIGDTNARSIPTPTGEGTTWKGVAVGRFHACAETTAHAIRCTGANESGELGVGDTNRRNLFTDVATLGTR
jgi:alpha-tubulin suppressor-like RCC1 family protein